MDLEYTVRPERLVKVYMKSGNVYEWITGAANGMAYIKKHGADGYLENPMPVFVLKQLINGLTRHLGAACVLNVDVALY